MTRRNAGPRGLGLKLRAVHVRAAGPEKARFDPLTLDFTREGEAADKVLLHLVNTGGKTTLIRLVSSVLAPAARDQVGKANIGEYVATGDTTHVVLLWDTESGPLVTGVVAEWPQRSRPAGGSMSELHRRWYAYRPNGPGTSVEDLPYESVDDTGRRRRRTAADFMSRLEALMQDHPLAQFQAVTTQAAWERLLEAQTPLDPELWRMQMRMNDVETGASALVSKFSTPDAVVQFFLEALNDTEALKDFTDTLATYANAASLRDVHVLELEFCAEMRAALAEYAASVALEKEAAGAAEVSRLAVAELAGALDARLARESEVVEQARRDQEEATSAQSANEKEVNRLEWQRQQLGLQAARLSLAAAEVEEAEAELALQLADEDVAAWKAVPVVNRRAEAAARLRAAALEFEKAEGELSPLRDAATRAGADLAAKLGGLAAEADVAAAREIQEQKDALARRASAGADQDAINQKLRDLAGATATCKGVQSAFAEALTRLRASGVCDPAEGPGEAAARHAVAAGEARSRVAAAEARAGEVRSLQEEARAELSAVEQAAAQAAAVAAEARRVWERYETARTGLGASDAVAELADLPSGPDVVADANMAALLALSARQFAEESDRAARVAQASLDRVEPEISVLEQTDMASPAEEVLAVADRLVAAGVGAVPAVRWAASNLRSSQERTALLASHPEFGTAVVVSDSRQLDRARAVLEDASTSGRVPVLVCGPERLQDPGAASAVAGFVVQPHRALTDPDGARALLAELRAEVSRLRDEVARASERASLFRTAEGSLTAFVTEWQDVDAAALGAAVDAADQEVVRASEAVDAAKGAVDALASEAERLLQDRLESAAAAAEAQARADRCQEVDEARKAASEAAARLADIEAALKQADKQRADAAASARSAQADADAALERASHYQVQSRDYRQQLREVPVAPSLEVPSEALGSLREGYSALLARLRAEEAGSVHTVLLEQAQEEDARAAAELDRLGSVAAAAVDRAGRLEAADADSLRDQQEAAGRVLREAHLRVGVAAAAVRSAQTVLQERSPKDRAIHASLPQDWDVSSQDSVDRYAARVGTDLAARLVRRTELDAAVTRHASLVAAASAACDRLATARSMVPDHALVGGVPTGMPAFSDDPVDAQARVRSVTNAYALARDAATAAGQARDGGWASVQFVARDAQWVALTSSIKDRCRVSPAEEVASLAGAWVSQLDARVVSLEHDLSALDRHRDQLVTRLANLCDAQRRLLNDVTRQSQLPDGLGALSGQPAFKITFDPLPADEARRLLTGRVDAWAGEIARLKDRRVRSEDRIRWLSEALGDTVRNRPQLGRFHVQVLKPSIDGIVEYRDPERVAKEYSGGQELTLAVLLYCALASVRAGHRTTGARPPGVLLLDNPFGAASNPRLIELQQALALRAGVQLVCATGLNDAAVKHAFDGDGGVVVSLRNDRDQRRGLQYLRVREPEVRDSVVRAVTGGRSTGDPAGYLDAVSYRVVAGPPRES